MAPMKPERRERDPDVADSLSLEQLARRWRMTRRQVRQVLGTGKLAFVQIRGRFRVSLDEVERYEREGGPS